MNKFSKPATLVLINALVGFSYTANTVAQEKNEVQRRESRVQQQGRDFSPDDLRLNSEFSEYLPWSFRFIQRPEVSGLTPLRHDAERSHDHYPQYLLPTQDEQHLRIVSTEEDLRRQQGETDQGQAFGAGIVLQTEQRQPLGEVIPEPRRPRAELVTDNADNGTEYLQQEHPEDFVGPLKNSSLVNGGTIVQQENVRGIEVVDGHQLDGHRVIQDQPQLERRVTEQRVETRVQLGTQETPGEEIANHANRQIENLKTESSLGQRVIEGHQFIEGRPQIQGQRVIESPQVVQGQLPVKEQRVFESTEQIQQRTQFEPQLTEQRV